MRNILLIGAGKSTAYLIDYLLDQSKKEDISLCILDRETTHIPKQIASHPALSIVTASVTDDSDKTTTDCISRHCNLYASCAYAYFGCQGLSQS